MSPNTYIPGSMLRAQFECRRCRGMFPPREMHISFEGRPDGGPYCRACLLRWWRQELLLLLFEHAIDDELLVRKRLLAEGRSLLTRVTDDRQGLPT